MKKALLTLSSAVFALFAQGATITVTDASDNGAGTFRQALTDAAAGDTINFDLPVGTTIQLNSALTVINKTLVIDASANITNGAPGIELNLNGNGLDFIAGAEGSKVVGLSFINQYSGFALTAIQVNDITVDSCYIGVKSNESGSGNSKAANFEQVVGLKFTNNVVGNNYGQGVRIYGSSDIVVSGNFIGITRGGNDAQNNGATFLVEQCSTASFTDNYYAKSNGTALEILDSDHLTFTSNVFGLSKQGVKKENTTHLKLIRNSHITVTDNWFSHCNQVALELNACDSSVVSNNLMGSDGTYSKIDNMGNSAFLFENGGTAVEFTNNTVLNYGQTVVNIANATDVEISNNTFGWFNQRALAVKTSSDVTIADNLFGVSPDGDVMNIQGGILINDNSSGVTIESNLIGNGSQAGIEIDNADTLAITNNIIGTDVSMNLSYTMTNTSGITVNNADSVVVTGNTVGNCQQTAIQLANVDRTLFENNYVGTDVTGTKNISNDQVGVNLTGENIGQVWFNSNKIANNQSGVNFNNKVVKTDINKNPNLIWCSGEAIQSHTGTPASFDAGATSSDKIVGTTNSALANATIMIFDLGTCTTCTNSQGHGESLYATVTANSNGAWSYTPSGIMSGHFSALAIMPDGQITDFSACIEIIYVAPLVPIIEVEGEGVVDTLVVEIIDDEVITHTFNNISTGDPSLSLWTMDGFNKSKSDQISFDFSTTDDVADYGKGLHYLNLVVISSTDRDTASLVIWVKEPGDILPTTTEEIEAAGGFIAYPNPTAGILNISSNEAGSITLVNNVGQIVLRHTFTGGIQTLDISHLPTGWYGLNFNGSDHNQWQKVLVR